MHRHPRIHNGATTQRLLPPLRALTPDLEPGVVAAYGTLGASAVGFVGTFAVAPRFREQFKEDLDWREIYAALVQQGGVRTVTAQDAYRQTSGGKAVLLDVRMARKYEQGHAVNAVNVPLYNPISKWDIPSIIRRAGFAFFGIYGTELNRDFAAQAELALAKSKDIYVCAGERNGVPSEKEGGIIGCCCCCSVIRFCLHRCCVKWEAAWKTSPA